MLEIDARKSNGVVILDLCGRIDVDAASFVEVVGQCIRDGSTDILCNFEEVDYIDYMGVSVIVIAYKEVANNSGRMKFANVPTHLRSVLSISGMDKTIEIYSSEEAALESFKEDKIIENIKKMQLRRRFKRLPIDIKVELKSKYDKCATCMKLDILNLSAVGAFIFGCEDFKLGDEVIIKFKLPPSVQEQSLDAVVVWLPDKQVQPHAYPGIGVEFSNLSPAFQTKLVDFIERNFSNIPVD